MPKKKIKAGIHIDLLKPQSNPTKLPIKLMRWLLSTGRFMFVFVEGLVLIAFIARFKFDADLASKKEAIEAQVPYIKSLKPYEILIRQTQLKLTSIKSIRTDSINYSLILQKIASLTPTGVKITSINLGGNLGKTSMQMSAQTASNGDMASFISGLKNDQTFSDAAISSVGLEQGLITFTISASIKEGGKNL